MVAFKRPSGSLVNLLSVSDLENEAKQEFNSVQFNSSVHREKSTTVTSRVLHVIQPGGNTEAIHAQGHFLYFDRILIQECLALDQKRC